jgi:hypothetical protein
MGVDEEIVDYHHVLVQVWIIFSPLQNLQKIEKIRIIESQKRSDMFIVINQRL